MTSDKTHPLQAWYMAHRRQGETPKNALWSARLHFAAESKAVQTLNALSTASALRISRFVDCFIRSEAVRNLTSERDADFINEPERAERCYDAAESGADGKTHSEVIEDWRDAFGYWISDRRSENEHDRFESAVRAHFTITELWHAFNGSLFSEIG